MHPGKQMIYKMSNSAYISRITTYIFQLVFLGLHNGEQRDLTSYKFYKFLIISNL